MQLADTPFLSIRLADNVPVLKIGKKENLPHQKFGPLALAHRPRSTIKSRFSELLHPFRQIVRGADYQRAL